MTLPYTHSEIKERTREQWRGCCNVTLPSFTEDFAGLNEAGIRAELIERDLPYYDPVISEDTVAGLNRFARDVGLLARPLPYEQVVATAFRHLWHR